MGLEGKASWHDEYKDSAYVFVGNVDYRLTEGDVLALMSQYGEIMDINYVRDKKTGKPLGFCFLQYEDQRSTVLAVDNMNGVQLLGRTLRVDHVKRYRRKKEEEDEDNEETTQSGETSVMTKRTEEGESGDTPVDKKPSSKPHFDPFVSGSAAPFSLRIGKKGNKGSDDEKEEDDDGGGEKGGEEASRHHHSHHSHHHDHHHGHDRSPVE